MLKDIDFSSKHFKGMSELLKKAGYDPSSKILNTMTRKARYKFSKIFDVSEDTEIFQVLRLRLGNEQPIAIENTYILHDSIPDIENIDLSKILNNPFTSSKHSHHEKNNEYDFKLNEVKDTTVLYKQFKEALDKHQGKEIDVHVTNIDRSFGTLFGSEITKKYGTSLEEDTFKVNCYGAGGQSFGAFIPQGLTLHLYGDSNDYFGKGLSGGKLIVVPPKDSTIKPEDNIIIGNVALYGATSGEVYINGVAGERFAIRNSGAHAVVEGIGDHGLEYMTGGMVIVLGKTGRNFAAGMSGGITYVYDPDNTFYEHVNKELVEYKNVKSRYDEDQLKEMIQKHYQYTNSNKFKQNKFHPKKNICIFKYLLNIHIFF